MRRSTMFCALITAMLLLAGCSQDAKPGGTDQARPSGGAFPVTIDTQFGPVTIEHPPKRVVALGWGDAATAMLLGVQPVGASDWLGFGGDGLGPWTQQRYTKPPKLLGTQNVNLEELAALQPDLILDTRSVGKQERQDKLSKLGVPVVGIPPGAKAYKTTWEDQLMMIGKALGKTELAESKRAELNQKFDAAAEQHPNFKGKTVVVGSRTAESYGAYVNGDIRVEFMRRLGFVNSPAVQKLAEGNFYVPLSGERLDLLDADLTVMFAINVGADEIANDPLYRLVPSVQKGHSVLLSDKTLSNAFSSATVPGLTYALDKVLPKFAEALG